ncbi:MAG TPA: glycosyl hydrolase family 28-related protein [Bacillota bacterium]|nr:glycosyl hydrolase family 28-related protein [Bacillota bacterium]
MYKKLLAITLIALLLIMQGCSKDGHIPGPTDQPSETGDSIGSQDPEESDKPGLTDMENWPMDIGWQLDTPSGGITPAAIPAGFNSKNETGVQRNLRGLNFIDDTSPITEVASIADADKKDRVAGEPYAVDIKYDDGLGVCVAIYNVVEDFGAKGDGIVNDSFAIQKALHAARDKGGGVVYLPEGQYLCERPLEIPSGVTLRGEWVSPEYAKPGSCGSVLLVTGNKGRENSTAFMSLYPAAGIKNLTILYPDQSADEILKYPATIQEVAGGDNYTVMNTTIAGAWVGYQGSIGWSELHYLKNVYITAFNNAIMLDTVTDIGRLEGVHLSPKYLTENVLVPFNDADTEKIREYMFNNSTGLWMKRSDWEYTYNFSAEGLNRGILLLKNAENRAPNAQFMKLEFNNCKVAIEVAATNGIGCAFTDTVIRGDENSEAGVLLGNDFIETVQFENLHIEGKIKEQISYKGSGRITLVNSTFQGWDSQNDYAINMHRGGISLQQCSFEEPAKHMTVSDTSGGVSVLGCSFDGTPDIKYSESRDKFVIIDHEPMNLPVKSGRQHVYRQSIPRPSSMYVYNVLDFGAQSGADSTQAFKKALDAAGKTGGTVYLPAGDYTISDQLVVPSGVELKGIYDVPSHPKVAGSIINTTYGKGDEDGKPLILLEENSGVNGVSFYYPEQSYIDFIPYPWTVQSLGENCWAINAVFINSYNGLDFGTHKSDGHYVDYISGSPIRRGIFAGNNSSNGWIRNIQFNPHYWKRSSVSTKPDHGEDQFNQNLNYSLDAIILGDNASEHMLGNFAFSAKNLLVLTSQGGKGTNGTFIGHGSDGCRNALVVEQADVVEFINAELVSMSYVGDMHHIIMEEDVRGTVALFNSMMWAVPSTSILVKGGTLIMNQVEYHGLERTEYLLEARGGNTYISTMLMLPKTVQVRITNNAKVDLIGNLLKQALSFVSPSGGAKVRVENIEGTYEEEFTWWS